MKKVGTPHLRSLSMLLICVLLTCGLAAGCAAAPSAPVPAPAAAPAAEPVAPTPTPEPTVDCGIPDLQYETEAYALDTLRSRGIVAVIEYDESESVLPGLVESQSVNAGVCVQNGQPVKLKIAKALPSPTPEPTPTPKPRNDGLDETEGLLSEATAAPVNVTYVDGIAVTPQPSWNPETFEFDFDDPGPGAGEPCG